MWTLPEIFVYMIKNVTILALQTVRPYMLTWNEMSFFISLHEQKGWWPHSRFGHVRASSSYLCADMVITRSSVRWSKATRNCNANKVCKRDKNTDILVNK